MNWSLFIRQSHRWISIAFTLGFIANGIAVARNHYTNWLGLTALLPLILLLLTGLYLFVLPYIAKHRNKRP